MPDRYLFDNDIAVIYLSSEFDYTKLAFADALDYSNVFYFEYPLGGIKGPAKWAYLFHGSSSINSKIRLPFQWIWNKYEIDRNLFSSYRRAFVIYSFRRLNRVLNAGLVEYINRIFTQAIHIMYWDDLIPNNQIPYLQRAKNIFDDLYTYDWKQAEEYQIKYHTSFLSKMPISNERHYKSDAFFVGNAKNRLGAIHQIYDELEESGLECKFFVNGVSKKEQSRKGITYNQIMPYSKATQYAGNTRCIIDISQHGASGVSFRPHEALLYGKLLLSNNPELKHFEYYDPAQMRIFKSPSQGDAEFIARVGRVRTFDAQKLSPIRFLEDLCRQYL